MRGRRGHEACARRAIADASSSSTTTLLDSRPRRDSPAGSGSGRRSPAAMVLEPELLRLRRAGQRPRRGHRVRILELLVELRPRERASLALHLHDLGSLAGLADRLVVLYRGRIVEDGPTEQVFTQPEHPYTRLLLDSAPTIDVAGADRERRAQLRADVGTVAIRAA